VLRHFFVYRVKLFPPEDQKSKIKIKIKIKIEDRS